MWSGPRNISTAMMRAWENRCDTVVIDEPLYAHYLSETGLDHPGAAEIIRHDETDWQRVVDRLLAPLPSGVSIFYQKHMAHHLLPGIDRAWLGEMTNCFLIREPREMLTSLIKVIPEPRLEDTGLPQQVEIFEMVRDQTGAAPPVLDSRDVLENPEGMLRALCASVGVPFDPNMLHWPPGPRESDGVWARHWYASVWRSTGFGPYRPKTEEVPGDMHALLKECEEHYKRLYDHRIHI